MANASLNIPITGDASALIAEVNRAAAQLKKIQEEFNNAFTTKGRKLKVQIDESLIEGSIADLKQKLKSLEETRANISPFDVNALKAINIEIKTTQDEIKRLQNLGVKRLEILPPPGSIAALKNELADLIAKRNIIEPFRIEHLTDVANRIAFIKDEIKRVESIGVQVKAEPISPVLENSIAGLQEKLNKLRNAQINIDVVNEKEIAQTNDEIKRLETEILRLRGLSIDPSGKLTQSSAKARQAITSLSLVAQDAAFGFIAIQNNLPAVLQTFTELETKNKGVKGALKELGSALVGPAGVFLAFSVVTGAVTYAVKEYGSLGDALDALFGKTDALAQVTRRTAESYKEYRKNLITTGEAISQVTGSQTGQIAKAQALAGIVIDLSKSEKERKTALQELKSLDNERFKNFDIEKGKYEGLIQAVDGLTNSLIANAIANKLADRASDLAIQERQATNEADQLYLRQQEILRTSIDVNEQVAEYKKRLKEAKTVDQFARASIGISQSAIELLKVNDQLENADLRASNLRKELAGLKVDIKKAVEEANKFSIVKTDDTNKIKSFTPTIDSQALDEAFNLDAIISNLTKYGNALIDVNNTEKERKNALRELLEIDSEYFKTFDLSKSKIGDYKDKIETLIRTIQIEKKERQDLNRVLELNEQFRKNEEKGIKSLGDKYNIFKDELSSFPKTFEEIEKGFQGNLLQSESQIKNALPSSADIKKATEPLKEIQKQYELAYDALNKVFFDPLNDLFDEFLKTGKFTFKEFTKSVLANIREVVSKALASGVIQILANILNPTGMLASFGGSFGGNNGNPILDALGKVFGADKKKADYNGVRPQLFGRGGEKVEFTIRGTNLVGVLNRANGEINRIG